MDEVNVVLVASDTFSQRNQGATIGGDDRALAPDRRRGQRRRAALRHDRGRLRLPLRRRGRSRRWSPASPERRTTAGRWRSPWPTRSASACRPRSARWLERVRKAAPGIPLRAHFHNTRNTGYANAFAAVEAGIDSARRQHRRLRRLPVRPERHRQHRHRGPRLRLASLRHRHRGRRDIVCEPPSGSSGLLGKAAAGPPRPGRILPARPCPADAG